MGYLTEIENKVRANQLLSSEDLIFLYERDSKIEGFGFYEDPRVEEIRSQRNPDQDMPIVFNCGKENIARNSKQINSKTKVYSGDLSAETIKKLRKYNVEYVYTSFPGDRIQFLFLMTGTPLQVLRLYLEPKLDRDAKEILEGSLFDKSYQKRENLDLILLKLRDLGLKERPRISDILKRAEDLGLEVCPPYVGPYLRIMYQKSQPFREINIGMKPISSYKPYVTAPQIFRLDDVTNFGYLEYRTLVTVDAHGNRKWDLDKMFAFSLPR